MYISGKFREMACPSQLCKCYSGLRKVVNVVVGYAGVSGLVHSCTAQYVKGSFHRFQ